MSLIDPLGAVLIDPLIDPFGNADQGQPSPPAPPLDPPENRAYVGVLDTGELVATVPLDQLNQAGIIGETDLTLRWGPSDAGETLLVLLPAAWGPPTSFYSPDFPVDALPSFAPVIGARTISGQPFNAYTFGPLNAIAGQHRLTISKSPAPGL